MMTSVSTDKRKVVKAALRLLKVNEIQVDPSYQRGVVPKHKQIAANFNEHALGIPVVAERSDGSLWIVDGLQRLTALKIRNITQVRAEVFASTGPEDEAKVFMLINMNRTKLKPQDEYYAALTAHDETAWLVKSRTEHFGFFIPRGSHKGKEQSDAERLKNIYSVNTLLQVAKTSGQEGLDFVLDTIKRSWPFDPNRTKVEMFEGLYRFWRLNKESIDIERLIVRLETKPCMGIIYAANQGISDRAANMAEVIQKLYDKKRVPKKQ